MTSIPPVTIVGAGPGGLTLARYLQTRHIPVIIYEREESPNSRSQGGSLDLHQDTAILALKECGLYEDATRLMRGAEGEALKIMDKTGKVYMDENEPEQVVSPVKDGLSGSSKAVATGAGGAGRGRPEIDRTDLRNLLIESLLPGTIKWNHGVKSCIARDSSTYHLTFYDGSTTTTSILIGADGTFSKIRHLLHNMKPKYTGLTMFDMNIPPERMTSEFRRYIGKGAAMVLDDRMGMLPQMNNGGKCKLYPAVYKPENWLEENPLPEKGKREYIANLFDGWAEINRELIMATDEDTIVARKIWGFDPKMRWETDKTGVTVIGDAAHVMSPFAGEGVNQAMADGLDLGRALRKLYHAPRPRASLPPFPLSLLPITPSPGNKPILRQPTPEELYKSLRRFEKKMMRRVEPEMQSAEETLDICFQENGAKRFNDHFFWMMVYGIAGMIISAPGNWVRSLWEEDD